MKFHLTQHLTIFFISLALLKPLSENGTCGTGTIRPSHTNHYPIKDLKAIGKEDLGSYGCKCDSANKVIIARCNESSIVTLDSNY